MDSSEAADTNGLAAKVAFLSTPAGYAPGVAEATGIDTVETHLSWVFLTARHAYKLKKPVKVRRIDYRTRSARRAACHAEVRLNRRLADWVYLGVVPLTMAGDGRYALGGFGQTVDWLVKMVRLDASRLLDAMIAAGTVETAALNATLDHLLRFYARAPAALSDRSDYCDRLAVRITEHTDALAALLPSAHIAAEQAPALRQRLEAALTRLRSALAARAPRVVDGHGDLRPQHLWLGQPPAAIDCLEFDRDRRLLDPFDELAFLALECERLGAPEIGRHALARYAEALADPAPAELCAFYQALSASFRAVATLSHLADAAEGETAPWVARGRAYLDLAFARAGAASV